MRAAYLSSTSPHSKRVRKGRNFYLRMVYNTQAARSPENVSSRRDARGEVTCRVTEGHRGDHHTCGTYIYGINRIKWLYMIDGMVGALYGERVIASISGT